MAHITFIHGISNKPPKDKLLSIWKKALAEASNPIDLGAEGVTCEMVYWADVLYKNPLSDEEYESTEEAVSVENLTTPMEMPDRQSAKNATDEAWFAALEQRLGIVEDDSGNVILDTSAPPNTLSKELERIPLPGPIKDAFLKNFLRDVHHYLFNVEFSPRPGAKYRVQTEIRTRLVEALQRGEKKKGPHIIVSHSMGTVVAYDCLKRVSNCPSVDALVTIGSPLGIDEVQDKLKPEWTRDEGFPLTLKSKVWVNFFDKLDVVSRLDPYLASDFRLAGKQTVTDESQVNDGIWRHDISKYLRGMIVSKAISKLIGL